ncbi:glycoside hydrolase family 75 protein [Streptomyces sp. NPDC006314]|uniref:glycoside hydrolase family 75 protein n=1 Tax=Streptomyces sp. NPDC006314 TaxID=3154475 RepID=UPI0033A1993D
MRVPMLMLAAAGAAVLAPAVLPAPAAVLAPAVLPAPAAVLAPVALPSPAAAVPHRERSVARGKGAVAASDLLAGLGKCTQVSRGRYRTDAGSPATVPVCGTRDAVYWKADLDIDCDGRTTAHCNHRTDPLFAATTAFPQSDGRHLNAETLPYIVLPAPSRIWNPRAYGVRGGSVAAVVYRGRVRYAVVGDTGPRDIIGEVSYATARSLGLRADPLDGGADSGVTYIVFRNSRVHPIEDHAAAVAAGRRLAKLLVANR